MLKKLTFLILSLMTAGIVYAADDVPVDLDSGRPGEAMRVDDGTEFKVCADPDLMPYSNSKQEGFENKIAAVLAADLGKKLTFQFWPDRMGFIRNTLGANRCDVVMGTTSDNDAMRTSKPYYRAGHVFIYRKDSGYNITDWDSPDLRKGIIGIDGQSPASIPLRDHNLLENAHPYRMQRDLNLPPSYLIDDLVAGKSDIVIAWGPIGGYFAKQASIPLVVVPIPEYQNVDSKGKEYWNISIGVRKKDKDRMAMIQGALDRNMDKINKILDDYGVPHVPIVEGDKLEFKSKKETRGDVIPKSE